MVAEPIKVEGLNEFVRNLKVLDSNLPKMVRVAFNNAMQLVVDKARPGIPSDTGTAKASVKGRSTQTQARVIGGGAKAKYYPWLDFGGKRKGRGGGVATRPFYKEGRFIYAAYIPLRDSGEIENVMVAALLDVVAGAGIAVD